MSATTVVEIQNKSLQAAELAKFVARAAFQPPSAAGATESSWASPDAPLSPEGSAFLEEAKSKAAGGTDVAGFLAMVLKALPAVFAGGAPEADIEGATVLLFAFLNINTDASKDTVNELSSAIVANSSRPELQLRVLVSMFNFLDQRGTLKYDLFMQIVEYASSTTQMECLGPYLTHADSWAKDWSLSAAQARALFLHISQALDNTGDSDGAQTFRIRYLSTLEGDASAGEIAEAQPHAVRAVIGYIKAPVVSQRSNLIDFTAVKALEADAKHAKLYELLHIFATERLDKFVAFHEANPGYIGSIGLDHDDSTRTMRLLTLCSLAEESEVVSYAAIQEALQIAAEDVETWIVDAITLGVISGRMDQVEQHVVVSHWTQRVFGTGEWVQLQSKLTSWRDNIASLLDSMRAARAMA